jgi:membrane-associated phospholipid phosphatase
MAVGVLPLVILIKQSETLLMINGNNSKILDQLMYHITRLPELFMIIFVIVLAAFHERKVFLSTIIAMSICGLSIVIFKQIIFSDFERPLAWLSSNNINYHKVDGIKLHSNGSFPSGHTMSAFCALAIAGFISKNGIVQFLLFLLACASAYSRVYVAQHYLMDVYAGALIGYFYALLFYQLFSNKLRTPYWQNSIFRKNT